MSFKAALNRSCGFMILLVDFNCFIQNCCALFKASHKLKGSLQPCIEHQKTCSDSSIDPLSLRSPHSMPRGLREQRVTAFFFRRFPKEVSTLRNYASLPNNNVNECWY